MHHEKASPEWWTQFHKPKGNTSSIQFRIAPLTTSLTNQQTRSKTVGENWRSDPAVRLWAIIRDPDELEQKINEAFLLHEYDVNDEGEIPDRSLLPCHAELQLDPQFRLPESQTTLLSEERLIETKANFNQVTQQLIDLLSQIEGVPYVSSSINNLKFGYSFRYICALSRQSDSSARDPTPRSGERQRGVH